MRRYCLALDLKEDRGLIRTYEEYHQKVWPGIIQSLKDSGIISMEIYRVENRMFMIMEVKDDFSFDIKAKMDLENPLVQEWEELMWTFQKQLPWAKPGEKWVLMDQIFSF
ncbi:MAG: L-rhamnose mutarotase [Chitinophagaceae bacterium]